MCVRVCVHVFNCVRAQCVCAGVHTCMLKIKADFRSLFQLLSILYIEHSLLIGPRDCYQLCNLHGRPSVSIIQVLELQVGAQAHLPFTWILGIPTLVLTANTLDTESFLQTLSTFSWKRKA